MKPTSRITMVREIFLAMEYLGHMPEDYLRLKTDAGGSVEQLHEEMVKKLSIK